MKQFAMTKSRPSSRQVFTSALFCAFLAACGSEDGISDPPGGEVPEPQIDSVDPGEGDFEGGTLVTLTGVGFEEDVEGDTTVRFGLAESPGVEVLDDQTIFCLSPAGTPGDIVDVTVINSRGTGSLSDAFLYIDESQNDPEVDSIDPIVGLPADETLVTITGSQFALEGAGDTTVQFGENAATNIVVENDTTITCDSPPGVDGETVDVVVSNDHGSGVLEDAFSYLDPSDDPILDSIDPTEGAVEGGETVTLSGSQFALEGVGETIVEFGENAATDVDVVSGEEITCTSPAGNPGETVDIRVTNALGSVTLAAAYHYIDPAADDPQIYSIDPASGEPDEETPVTIMGSQFELAGAGETTVSFGEVSATDVVVVSDDEITCNSPVGVDGETVDVVVSNDLGSGVLEDAFLYEDTSDDPIITSIDPAVGLPAGGLDVTITGSQFTETVAGETSVFFGENAAENVVVVSDIEITCASPAGEDNTSVEVSVVNPRGTGAFCCFDYLDPSDDPSISGFAPTEGDFAGGTVVTITGSQFTETTLGETSVDFGGNPATDVVVEGDETITCVSPAGDAGSTVALSVHNSRGSSSLTGFTYTGGEPVLLACDPIEGAEDGGDLITLTGERFSAVNAGVTSVSFGGALATSLLVVDDATITCVSPSGEGTVAITVVNDLGASEDLVEFTYLEDLEADEADLDGDGLMDLVVGTPLGDSNGGNAGVVQVFLSSGTLTSEVDLVASSADITIGGAADGDRFGATVATGDLNGDGDEDLVIGAPQAEGHGMVYVFSGPLEAGSLSSNDADHIFSGEGTFTSDSRIEDRFGFSLSVEDIDADGIADLVVGAPGADYGASGTTIFASGLRSPMGLFIASDGSLWVAQSGSGSADPEDPVATALDDAGVSRIDSPGAVEDIVAGLPSMTDEGFVGGTADLMFDSAGSLVVAQQGGASLLSNSVLEFDVSSWMPGSAAQGPGDVMTQWDVGTFGASMGFDDNNTYGVAEGADGHLYVVNAGANAIFKIERPSGVMSVFATFPQVDEPSPFGPPFTDSVPTRILAHDGGFYVVNLTGFPFNDGAASVFDVDYSGVVTELVTGLSRATDVAVDPRDGTLYVTQFDGFDLMASPPWLFGTGAVVRVTGSGVETVANVTTPTGIAIDLDGTMYVSSMITGLIYRYEATAPAVVADVGAVYTFRGGSDLGAFVDASGANVLLTGDDVGDKFGCSTAVGDFNGDGQVDLFVGAPGASTFVPEHHWNGGAVFLWLGPLVYSGSTEDADASYYMLETDSAMGCSVKVGDVNGDGFDDLVTGAPMADSEVSGGAGRCLVFHGDIVVYSKNATSADVILHGMNANGGFSTGLVVADFNGDGVDDIFVTAPADSYGANRNGRAFLFAGGPVLGDAWGSGADVILTGRFRDFEHFGVSAGAVDLDADGVLDICVGAHGGDSLIPAAGSVHVFLAGAGLVDTDAVDDDLTLEGEVELDRFGSSISSPE